MNKLLTIGLAAATLAGGVAATSGAAQAADWNHGGGGYESDHGRGGGYESDHDRGGGGDHYRGGDRHDRRWERGYGGYGYGYGYGYRDRGCRQYRTWNSYWGRYTMVTRCF